MSGTSLCTVHFIGRISPLLGYDLNPKQKKYTTNLLRNQANQSVIHLYDCLLLLLLPNSACQKSRCPISAKSAPGAGNHTQLMNKRGSNHARTKHYVEDRR